MENLNVLVVDDDPDAVNEIAEGLVGTELVVEKAFSGAEALEAVMSNPNLDVVVADLFMNGMSGFELMSECHANARPGLPFILMTSYPSYELAIRSIRTSAVDLVEKPISFDDLKVAIQRAVREKDGRDRSRRTPPEVVNDLIRLRNGIQRILSPSLSSDPCLDLLLHLSQVEGEGQMLPISAACVASGVPMSTGLRRISELVADGLIQRQESPTDRRSSFLRLTDKGRMRVAEIVEAARLALLDVHETNRRDGE